MNLKKRTLEVYRQPSEDENAYYDFSYEKKITFGEEEEVSPLAMPQAKIKIADLLP